MHIIQNYETLSHNDRNHLQKEIMAFQLLLTDYKITFSDLTNSSPSQREIRQDAINVARIISENTHLKTSLQDRKKLPLKGIQMRVPTCHKTLKKYKIYIIALALIFIGGFTLIKEYLNF